MNNAINQFIDKLYKLTELPDRATLAELRRGLGRTPAEAIRHYRFVFANVPDGLGTDVVDAAALVASLFALYPEPNRENRTMGAVLRDVSKATQSGSVEKRFTSLLDADREDLSEHLRYAISLAKSKVSPPDWKMLLWDVVHWNDEERKVQQKWANEFWRPQTENEGDKASPAASTNP